MSGEIARDEAKRVEFFSSDRYRYIADGDIPIPMRDKNGDTWEIRLFGQEIRMQTLLPVAICVVIFGSQVSLL